MLVVAEQWGRTVYGVLSDVTVLVHLAFVLFVLLGGLVVFRWRRFVWCHIPAALWGTLMELFGCVCPLTPLENWLRERSGAFAYKEGFVAHFILPVLYPEGLTRELQTTLGILVLGVNVVIYGLVLRSIFWKKRLSIDRGSSIQLKGREMAGKNYVSGRHRRPT